MYNTYIYIYICVSFVPRARALVLFAGWLSSPLNSPASRERATYIYIYMN